MFQNLQLSLQNKILLVSFAIFIILYFILHAKNKEAPAATENKPLYADTLIPKGQVLVPIELANIESLTGLIDQFGIIDLYGGAEKDSTLLASRVKILKAPLNPNRYAVMVSENLSREIMKHKGPFWAVLQNRLAQSEPPKPKETPPSRPEAPLPVSKPNFQSGNIEIEYYQGDNQ